MSELDVLTRVASRLMAEAQAAKEVAGVEASKAVQAEERAEEALARAKDAPSVKNARKAEEAAVLAQQAKANAAVAAQAAKKALRKAEKGQAAVVAAETRPRDRERGGTAPPRRKVSEEEEDDSEGGSSDGSSVTGEEAGEAAEEDDDVDESEPGTPPPPVEPYPASAPVAGKDGVETSGGSIEDEDVEEEGRDDGDDDDDDDGGGRHPTSRHQPRVEEAAPKRRKKATSEPDEVADEVAPAKKPRVRLDHATIIFPNRHKPKGLESKTKLDRMEQWCLSKGFAASDFDIPARVMLGQRDPRQAHISLARVDADDIFTALRASYEAFQHDMSPHPHFAIRARWTKNVCEVRWSPKTHTSQAGCLVVSVDQRGTKVGQTSVEFKYNGRVLVSVPGDVGSSRHPPPMGEMFEKDGYEVPVWGALALFCGMQGLARVDRAAAKHPRVTGVTVNVQWPIHNGKPRFKNKTPVALFLVSIAEKVAAQAVDDAVAAQVADGPVDDTSSASSNSQDDDASDGEGSEDTSDSSHSDGGSETDEHRKEKSTARKPPRKVRPTPSLPLHTLQTVCTCLRTC